MATKKKRGGNCASCKCQSKPSVDAKELLELLTAMELVTSVKTDQDDEQPVVKPVAKNASKKNR